MRKFFMGLLTHVSTTLLVFILVEIFNKLSGIRVQAPLSKTVWISFFFALVIYVSLGNLYYKNLSSREKIISTLIVMIVNTVMGILIFLGPYQYAFIIKLIHAGFNNAFAPLSFNNSLLNFSFLALLPLLLLVNIKFSQK